ncbi:hypothetical protein FRC14_004998 [Serendipita sp. 396]|nr:hypothetical protein FRC14_004998 [Serendipita sp. 396]KAG8774510.1 hypothetical protein FRC15_001251 [Serendipita sp. 397]KAG8790118.1 hypothetical protein FRC16_001022 [Serendipita sp. 398]KAG8866306.1 hypothetical protein FRC20_008856 [Serendipita sp. 405]
MSLHSPSVLVTPPMHAIQALGDKDETLEALMEDYIRASELQLSLKRRIEAAMREKEERAKQEEEIAMAVLRAAEQKRVQLREANRILKERMRKAAGIEVDESTVPTSARPIPVELPQSRIRTPRTEPPRPYSPCIQPPSPLRPPLRPTTPVFVMPNLAPAARPFNPLEVTKEVTNIDTKKKKGKGKKGKYANSIMTEPATPVRDFDSPHDLCPRQELNPVDDFYAIQELEPAPTPPRFGFGR